MRLPSFSFVSIRSSSAGRWSGSLADMRIRSFSRIGRMPSFLFMTVITGMLPAPSSARVSSVTCMWFRYSGSVLSTIIRIRSAWRASSSVERNASTSPVGRSSMKPTVSESRKGLRPEGAICRTDVSRVANSMSCSSTCFSSSVPQQRIIWFIRVDFPAFV